MPMFLKVLEQWQKTAIFNEMAYEWNLKTNAEIVLDLGHFNEGILYIEEMVLVKEMYKEKCC